MPLKNFHACRLVDPAECHDFRVAKETIKGKPVNVIYAKNKRGELVRQSVRFPKEIWTEEEARKHCNGTFHPASE